MPTPSKRTGPVCLSAGSCAEACLASTLVMHSVRLAEAPRWSDMPTDPLPTKAALQIPHIRGIMSLYTVQTGTGRDNGVREMVFPLQLAAC